MTQEAFRRLICGIQGKEPGAGPGGAAFEGACPYRGLEVFDVEHAPFFFGREALTEWLVNELRPTATGQENRFLAVLGRLGQRQVVAGPRRAGRRSEEGGPGGQRRLADRDLQARPRPDREPVRRPGGIAGRRLAGQGYA